MKKKTKTIIIASNILLIIIIIYFLISGLSKKSCSFNGKLKDGSVYVEGLYTYTYIKNDTETGWHVELTDKNSTAQVNSSICGKIDEQPIISTKKMFENSKAKIIDISSFDSSNVTNMSAMFSNSAAISIIGLDKLNTSKVKYMDFMFAKTNVSSLILTNFNTGNVINMANMFDSSKATIIKVTSFDTSKVINMSAMFYDCQCEQLNLESFDITNVKYLNNIFKTTVTKNIYYNSEEKAKMWHEKIYGK